MVLYGRGPEGPQGQHRFQLLMQSFLPLSQSMRRETSWRTSHSWYKSLAGYIKAHLFPPVGWDGFWDFSICPIIKSNALETLKSRKALASVKAQWMSSANCRPSSRETWRCSGFKSLLLPTITKGTSSAPCCRHRVWIRHATWRFFGGIVHLQDDLRSCPEWSSPSQRTVAMLPSTQWYTHGCQWNAWSSRCCIHPKSKN